MTEDFGWSGDEFLIGDCQDDRLESCERDLCDIVREHDEGEDCPLDGDTESALASAGFGTDEDYGGYTHDWEE